MNRKLFTTFALVVGMATPALADGTHTISVWGANVDRPGQSLTGYTAPADRVEVGGRPYRWADIRTSAPGPAVNSGLPLSVGDEDGGNARDPALPAYERGRGQETGGPGREFIPD